MLGKTQFMAEDVLDDVDLDLSVVKAWHAVAYVMPVLVPNPSRVGHEKAFVQADGTLLIRCAVGDDFLCIRVPPQLWRWKKTRPTN